MPKLTKTVLLLGSSAAAYRPALWASYFMERSQEYSLLVDTCNWGQRLPRPIRIALRLTHMLIVFFACDIVVIQPMTQGSLYCQLILRFNQFFGKKIILDVYISLYETLVIDRKQIDGSSKQAKKTLDKDRRAFLGASSVVFLNHAECDYYHKILQIKLGSLKTAIIPLVTSDRPLAKRPFLHGTTEMPTIVWWGREGNPLHGFENIAEACRLLLDSGFKAHFAFFCAGGPQWDDFREKYRYLEAYDQVTFSCEYTFTNGRLDKFLEQEADFALGTFGDTRKAKTVLVNKILDAGSYGLPCLTQFSVGMMEFFAVDKNVFLSEISPEAIAMNLSTCLSKPEACLQVGDNSRTLVREQFNAQSFHRGLDEVFRFCESP